MPPNSITAAFETTSSRLSCEAGASSGSTVARGERAGDAAPQLRLPVRLDLVDQTVDLGAHERVEALAHRREPERLGERLAVACMLGAVAREHARSDHTAC